MQFALPCGELPPVGRRESKAIGTARSQAYPFAIRRKLGSCNFFTGTFLRAFRSPPLIILIITGIINPRGDS